MRASSLFAAAAACAAVASAQVHLPFARRADSIAAAADGSAAKFQAPRDGRSVPRLELWADDWNYLVNVSVGTPPQQMSLRLAVQAGPSWVPDIQYCDDYYQDDATRDEDAACRYGAFNASQSSSLVSPRGESFGAIFANDFVSGALISDVLDVAGIPMSKFIMGFVDAANTRVGVLGLGFNGTYHKPNTGTSSPAALPLPERLVKDGIIASPAYSLWLDDKSAKSGNLLLGAVDKSKFEGPLIRIRTNSFSGSPLSRDSSTFDTIIYSINGSKSATDELQPLSGPVAPSEEEYGSNRIPVQLAPEYPVSVLPDILARDIWSLAGAFWNDDLSYAVIPCDVAETSTGYLVMQLDGTDGPVLNVSLADLVVSKDMWSYSKWSWDTESSTEFPALSGAMLKQAYMVFDLANAEMAIAQAKLGSTATEDIVPFAAYGASIPESTKANHVPSYCSASIYARDSPECTSDGSGSGVGSSGDSDDYGGGGLPSSISRSIKLGVGLGVGLFCFVVLCLSIWAIRRCRRIRKAEKESCEKQADAEQGTTVQAGAADGGNLGEDGSLPQKPPTAVVREPPTTNVVEGQHIPEDTVPTRP
ncbi:acid protease [Colletotrichum sublineola]|nr:acid protease [Colletotrichum sublineola]